MQTNQKKAGMAILVYCQAGVRIKKTTKTKKYVN